MQSVVGRQTAVAAACLQLGKKSLTAIPREQTTCQRYGLTRMTSVRFKGSRGARGHGWFQKYRSNRGGRHLQGRYFDRDPVKLAAINDEAFSLNRLYPSSETPTEAYLDICIDGEEPNRVVIELASTALPLTCRNFTSLCTGGGCEWSYKQTTVYKIEKTVGLCLGDVMHTDGAGGRCHPSVLERGIIRRIPFTFPDEPKVISHVHPGVVTMSSCAVNANDSRFIITTHDAPQLDGRFVAFGRVTQDTMDVIFHIANSVFTKRGRPTVDVKIVDCGILPPAETVLPPSISNVVN